MDEETYETNLFSLSYSLHLLCNLLYLYCFFMCFYFLPSRVKLSFEIQRCEIPIEGEKSYHVNKITLLIYVVGLLLLSLFLIISLD